VWLVRAHVPAYSHFQSVAGQPGTLREHAPIANGAIMAVAAPPEITVMVAVAYEMAGVVGGLRCQDQDPTLLGLGSTIQLFCESTYEVSFYLPYASTNSTSTA
jgi:hypothetical protein